MDSNMTKNQNITTQEEIDFLPKIPSLQTLNQIFDFDADSAYRLSAILYLLSEGVNIAIPNNSTESIKTQPVLLAKSLFEQIYTKIENPFKTISLDLYNLNDTNLTYTSIVKIAILKKDKQILDWSLNNFKFNTKNQISLSTVIDIKNLIELCGFTQNLWQKTDPDFCHYLNNLILPKIVPENFLNDPNFTKNIPAIRETTSQIFTVCQPYAKNALINGNISLLEEWMILAEKWRDTYCWFQYFNEIDSNSSTPHPTISVDFQNQQLINYLKDGSLCEQIHKIIPLEDYNKIIKDKNFSLLSRKNLEDFLSQTYDYLNIKTSDKLMQSAIQYCTNELAPREIDSLLNNISSSWGHLCLAQSEEQKKYYKEHNLNEVEFNKIVQKKQIALNLLFDKLEIPTKSKEFERSLELSLFKQNLWIANYYAKKIISNEKAKTLETAKILAKESKSAATHFFLYSYEKVNWSNFQAVYLPQNPNMAVDKRQMQLIFDLIKDSTDGVPPYIESFKKIYCNLTQSHLKHQNEKSTLDKLQIQKALLEIFSFLEQNNLLEECKKIIERIDIQTFPTDIASQLVSRGIKRFTYCGLAVIAGMWDLAEKLMDSGSDWRFAKKQIRDQVGLSHRDEALAFYERYELKHMLTEKQNKKKFKTTEQTIKPIEEKKSFRL